jgi:putative FmdB family regulatory protein
MATYEYECRDCGHEFVVLESLAQHGRKRPTCPRCRSASVERVFTPFYAKTIRKS